jgi:cation transport ATPase
VAVHGSAEASLGAADVFVATSGVGPLVELFEGARRTMAVIRRNLAFSLAYNVCTIALAMAGWVGPLTAAVLMPLSSLKVVTSSYRALTFQKPGRQWTTA